MRVKERHSVFSLYDPSTLELPDYSRGILVCTMFRFLSINSLFPGVMTPQILSGKFSVASKISFLLYPAIVALSEKIVLLRTIPEEPKLEV